MREIEIFVDADGSVQFVYSDEAAALFRGEAQETRRASHVEPDGAGAWTADLSPVGGPVLGPFVTRAEALGAEVAWLSARMANGALEPRP